MDRNDEGEAVRWDVEPQEHAERENGTPLRERVLGAACVALVVSSLVATSLWLQVRSDAKSAVARQTRALARSIAACVVRLTQNAAYQAWSWDAIQGRCAARVLAAAQGNARNAYLLQDDGP